MFEYILEHFSKDSSFINKIDELSTYLDEQNLDISEKCKIIREVYDYNNRMLALMKEENKKLERIISKVLTIKEGKLLVIPKKEESKDDDTVITLDINAKEYITRIKSCDNLDEIKSLLPAKSSLNYTHIVNIVILSLFEDIIDYKKMLQEDKKNMTTEEIDFFKNEINGLLLKVEYLKRLNVVAIKPLKIKNTAINQFIFLQTSIGNYSIYSDIKELAPEHYYLFLTLLTEMENGKFRNKKALNNNNEIQNTMEVKYNQARITFISLGNHKYAILDMFIKKVQSDAAYKASLKNKYDLYKDNSKVISSLLDNKDFLEQNRKVYKQVIEILNKEDKVKKLGVKHD